MVGGGSVRPRGMHGTETRQHDKSRREVRKERRLETGSNAKRTKICMKYNKIVIDLIIR
jgi:hypothetical protein